MSNDNKILIPQRKVRRGYKDINDMQTEVKLPFRFISPKEDKYVPLMKVLMNVVQKEDIFLYAQTKVQSSVKNDLFNDVFKARLVKHILRGVEKRMYLMNFMYTIIGHPNAGMFYKSGLGVVGEENVRVIVPYGLDFFSLSLVEKDYVRKLPYEQIRRTLLGIENKPVELDNRKIHVLVDEMVLRNDTRGHYSTSYGRSIPKYIGMYLPSMLLAQGISYDRVWGPSSMKRYIEYDNQLKSNNSLISRVNITKSAKEEVLQKIPEIFNV